MANSRTKQSSFYTHITVLNETTPKLQIKSLRFPELLLRLPTQNDAQSLLRLFNDPRNTQYDKSCDGINTPEAIDRMITQWTSFTDPLTRANIVITIHDQVVGVGGLGWIGQREADGAMFGDGGIMLDTEFRGKGYAYEALRMVIDHALSVLGLDEAHVSCVDRNVEWKRLMKKFGFVEEPTSDQFGNEWTWKIRRGEWERSQHSGYVD